VLLRGGRRVAEDWAVVALEVDGEGVEAGGEEDDAVGAIAPVGG
jgi:hypothetical protein